MVPHNVKITTVLPFLDPLQLQAKMLAYATCTHTMDIIPFVYINLVVEHNTKKNVDWLSDNLINIFNNMVSNLNIRFGRNTAESGSTY